MSGTVTVSLPYGEGSIAARLPKAELVSVAVPREMTAASNPEEEVMRALDNPIGSEGLESKLAGAKKVTVIVNDSTRPTPTWIMLPVLLERLKALRIPESGIELLVATGLHRPSTGEELRGMLGEAALSGLRVVNHDAFDRKALDLVGWSRHGTPLWLSRRILESDGVISLGYIEPHFFAGYTGGGKMVLPGVAGAESIMANHSAAMIDHPKARAGILEGNPIHEDMLEAARFVPPDFSLNTVLNTSHQITHAFGGELETSHRAAVRIVEQFDRVHV
ncbi:MAG: nickel-dependent lactate racemase, partial [Candidatus Bathyarchaeia archaeon]